MNNNIEINKEYNKEKYTFILNSSENDTFIKIDIKYKNKNKKIFEFYNDFSLDNLKLQNNIFSDQTNLLNYFVSVINNNDTKFFNDNNNNNILLFSNNPEIYFNFPKKLEDYDELYKTLKNNYLNFLKNNNIFGDEFSENLIQNYPIENKNNYQVNSKAKKYIEFVWNDLISKNYKPIYIAVYGTTNYNLDYYSNEKKSDFDLVAFVYPSFKDIYSNIFTSKTIEYNKDELGNVIVKDIRLISETLKKINSVNIEIFFTPYYKGNLNFIKEKINGVVLEKLPLLLKSIQGLYFTKEKTFLKKYKNFDYNPKEIMHSYRLLYMMRRLVYNYEDFGKVMFFDENSEIYKKLIDIRINGCGTLEEAKEIMNKINIQIKSIINMFWENENKCKYNISNKTEKIIQEYIYKIVRNYIVQNEFKIIE